MKNGIKPDPMVVHPIHGYDEEIYVKPTIKNPNTIVGDFTYIADSEFESHVTHHYEWNGDKLIIGKFCQIAAGVEFVMNGANHQMDAVSTFPFYTLEGWNMEPPALSSRGDTVVGNDVWIEMVLLSERTALSGAMLLPIQSWLEIPRKNFANVLTMN